MKLLRAPAAHAGASGRKLRPSIKARTRSHGDSHAGHMPRLDTIQMIEETIKNKEVFSSKNQLWRSLPKSMQYATLSRALEYLRDSNKIIIEKDGTIIWTFVDSPEARQSLQKSKPL